MRFMTLIMGAVLDLLLLELSERHGKYNDLDLASNQRLHPAVIPIYVLMTSVKQMQYHFVCTEGA
jgi:hypothetical protein